MRPSSLGNGKPLVRSMPSRKRRVAAAVLEDGVALDGVADVRLAGGGHRVAEDGDAAGAVELDEVAVAGRRAADEVEGHARLVGLRRAEGSAEAVGTAQDDAVQQVARRGDAVGADAGEVALDDVALAAVVDLDAGAVEADDVAAPAAAPPTVLMLPPEISMPKRLLPSAAPGAGAGSVRLPTLLLPSAATPTKLPWMMLPVAGVARVPTTWMPSTALPEAMLRSAGVGAADQVVRGVLDADAVAAVGEGAVGHPRRAGGVDADEVAR